MKEQRRRGHTVSILLVHLVWVTKYRYPVLKGDIQQRCRELIIQICDSEDIRITSGVVSKDHVHMLIEYPPRISISDLVKRSNISNAPERISCNEETILGQAILGNWLWSMVSG